MPSSRRTLNADELVQVEKALEVRLIVLDETLRTALLDEVQFEQTKTARLNTKCALGIVILQRQLRRQQPTTKGERNNETNTKR